MSLHRLPSLVRRELERGEILSLHNVLKTASYDDFGGFHWTSHQINSLRCLMQHGLVSTRVEPNVHGPPGVLQFDRKDDSCVQFLKLLRDTSVVLGPCLQFRTDVLTDATSIQALVQYMEYDIQRGRHIKELRFVKSYHALLDTYSDECAEWLCHLFAMVPKTTFSLQTSNGFDGDNARRILVALRNFKGTVPIHEHVAVFQMGTINKREAQQILQGVMETNVLTDWKFPHDHEFYQNPELLSLPFVADMIGTDKVRYLEARLFDGDDTSVELDPEFIRHFQQNVEKNTTIQSLVLCGTNCSKTAAALMFNTVFSGLNLTEELVHFAWKLTITWMDNRQVVVSADVSKLGDSILEDLRHLQGVCHLSITNSFGISVGKFIASLRDNYSLQTIGRPIAFAANPQVKSILKRNTWFAEAKKLTSALRTENDTQPTACTNDALMELLAQLTACEDDSVSLPALYHIIRNAFVHLLVGSRGVKTGKNLSGHTDSDNLQLRKRTRHT